MVFGRRRVVREIPENVSDAKEMAEILRARRVIESYGELWRELYHKLLLDVYRDSNIPDEDKQFVAATIIRGFSRLVDKGGLLMAKAALDKQVAELLRDLAAITEGKVRAKFEQASALLMERLGGADLGEEAFAQLFAAIKGIALSLYKDIQADNNIRDKRENWRAGFEAFIELVAGQGIPAISLLTAREGELLARATRLVLRQGDYEPEELLGEA